jgi:hypothetical protein
MTLMAKRARQMALPGMESLRPAKEAPRKAPKARRDVLAEELTAGNRPMFMTGGEIIKHANLGDAGMWMNTPAGKKKPPYQKQKESGVMLTKLKESKTGTYWNSHVHRSVQYKRDAEGRSTDVRVTDEPTLHESLSTEGLKSPINLWENRVSYGRIGEHQRKMEDFISLDEGHHRVAAMRNINPKQFLSINWENR